MLFSEAGLRGKCLGSYWISLFAFDVVRLAGPLWGVKALRLKAGHIRRASRLIATRSFPGTFTVLAATWRTFSTLTGRIVGWNPPWARFGLRIVTLFCCLSSVDARILLQQSSI
jgi:hypothetical protein